ncbi:MAG: zinc-dependent metalloprotease [Bacteroidales bacterium]
MNKKVCLTLLSLTLSLSTLPVSAQRGLFAKRKKIDQVESKNETDYDKALKGATSQEGMFKIHKVKGDYYFEIPDSLLGRDILIVNKVSGVPFDLNDAGLNKGMNYENKLIRFHLDKELKKVWVKTINPMITVKEDDAIAASVKDNFVESVFETFPIEGYSADSSVLIKVNKVFDGSEKTFNDLYNGISLGGSPKKDFSKIESIKSFPNNVIVKSVLSTTYSEGGKVIPLSVNTTTNLVLLSKEPMKPRFNDPRVGYFTTEHWYFNDLQQKVEKRQLVNRWRLEPKPEDRERYLNGELVEPLKPIIFYIDPSTPTQWQDYIMAGVTDWEEAFRQAGFKNAIQVKRVTEDMTDFDLDDVRYNVITYAASARANAMGPSIIDPRSGEIIEADVVWWHNVMTAIHSWLRVQLSATYPEFRPNVLSEKAMGEAIRFVSSHELGHTFGLTHNMGASSAYPVDSLRSESFTKRMGTSSSIMDYARFNYVAQPGDGVTSLNPVVGIYDKFAIEWAYRFLDTKTPQEELPILNEWIRKHENNPYYFYGETQDPKNCIDPRSQSEDLGDDAIKAGKYGIANLKRIVPNIVDWTGTDGETYAEAGKLLMGVLNQWQMYGDHVMANVGGFHINNVVKGNNIDRYVPIDKAKQKEAVKYLIDEIFIVPDWLFNDPVWKKSYTIQEAPMGDVEYSPYNVARELQYATFYNLLKDERLLRMYETEAQLGKEKTYMPEDMFDDIYKSIFKSSIAGKNLTLHERMTQKNFLDAIIVSSNKAVEKTTKKAIRNEASCQKGCCSLASSHAARFEMMPRPDYSATNLNYTAMNRVSEAVSVKRGTLFRVLELARSRKNSGDVSTRNHYQDLEVRIKEALNIK